MAEEDMDPGTCLVKLLESKRRQEQLMEKVCTLLVSLDGKVSQVAAGQEKLESAMLQAATQQPRAAAGLESPASGNVSPASTSRLASKVQLLQASMRKKSGDSTPRTPRMSADEPQVRGEIVPLMGHQPYDPGLAAAQRQAEADRIQREWQQAQRRVESVRHKQKTSGMVSGLLDSGGAFSRKGSGLFDHD